MGNANQNGHGKYSQTRLPRQKRTIEVPGSLEDSGKYFRCWNCGFINNVERNQLGEVSGSIPITYTDTDGNTKYKPDVVAGCAFCGCTNYH
jgi:hypothetical protein